VGRPVERPITPLGQAGREFIRRMPMSLASPGRKVYGDAMSFTLWLSAEEERILAKIMRHEGSRSKEQAVIKAIRDKADLLAADRPTRETPESADRTHSV
jgi:hypothetical protein